MVPTIFPEPEAIGDALAAEVARSIGRAAEQGRRFLLGCPGGRSGRPLWRALARHAAAARDDWSHVVVVMMDEYLLDDSGGLALPDPAAHFSCRGFAEREIVGPINAGLPAARRVREVWLPDPANPAAYDVRLEQAGGVDLFVLASGAGDGHVAFNGPGTPRDRRSWIAPLAEQTRRDNLVTFPAFGTLDAVPRHGVTVGVDTIASVSRAAVMLLWGADKRRAFRRVTDAAAYTPDWPATIVAECRNARVFADRAAAGA